MKKPELLAPAGDLKKLKYALLYGADAVYCGLPEFSLRVKTGFELKSLKTGVEYAHKLKKKVYITINIFAHNRNLKTLPTYLIKLKKIKPDGIIASDPGIIQIVKKYLPKTPIHLSTQANTLNYESVKFWQKQGIKRIILGREASLSDIKEIAKKNPRVNLETFVHGAMCLSYSGRCYLSAWLNERSANQGFCTQPCRWNYNVYLEEPLRPGQMIPITADKKGTYILNSKDLCLIDYLDELLKAGVMSFKIEGRTKSIYYLSVVVKAYRQAIDLLIDKKHDNKNVTLKIIKQELNKIDSRKYTTGFLLGNEEKTRQNFNDSKAKSRWEFSGEIIENNGEKIIARIHNILNVKDQLEIITPYQIYNVKISNLKNENGQEIKEARGGTEKTFTLKLKNQNKYHIPANSLLRKITK